MQKLIIRVSLTEIQFMKSNKSIDSCMAPNTSQDYALRVTGTDMDPVRRVRREAVRVRHSVSDREEEMRTAEGGTLMMNTVLLNDKLNEWFGPWIMTASITEL